MVSWKRILHLLSEVYVHTMTLCGQTLCVFITRTELGGTPKMKISKNSLPLARVDVNDFTEDFAGVNLPRLSQSFSVAFPL